MNTAADTSASRVMAWPCALIPVPAVFRPRIERRDGDVLVLSTPSVADSVLTSLPEEFFLRELLDVDLRDTVAIAEFTKEHGLLLFSRARQVGERNAEKRFWSPARDLDGLRRSLIEELRERAGVAPMHAQSLMADPVALPLVALLKSVQAQIVGGYPSGTIALHVDDFRLLAAEYRDLVRIWLALALGGDGHDAPWESPHIAPPEDPATFFASRLDLDLSRYAPRLLATQDTALQEDLGRTWSLNTAVAAQIYNDVAERPVYRRCALEDCGRLFARARGRSEHGRHRSDAKYCSKSCADVAMKRRQRTRSRTV